VLLKRFTNTDSVPTVVLYVYYRIIPLSVGVYKYSHKTEVWPPNPVYDYLKSYFGLESWFEWEGNV
jgi:hypothetical protein